MATIDSGRFDLADRAAIIEAVQALFDSDEYSGFPAALAIRGLTVGAHRRHLALGDMRPAEVQWCSDLADHVALGNRPASWDDHRDILVRAYARLLTGLCPDDPDPEVQALGLFLVRRLTELERA